MSKWTCSSGTVRRGAHGFTLIELLVVIVVIAILIGLLVPAVGAVQRYAHEVTSKAALASIDTGLESFKGEGKLGGAYPPSQSDWFNNNEWEVTSPYTNSNTAISISGGGLLVWALAGADLLGTPGFSPIDPADPTLRYWGQCTGNGYNSGTPTKSGAYALYPANHATLPNQPVHTRFGPYVDTSKLKVTRNEVRNGLPDFVIPAEKKVRADASLPAVQRQYPFFLDGFGYPILYWRADAAGRLPWDPVMPAPTVTGLRALYHLGDNGLVASNLPTASSEPELILNGAGERNVLKWDPGNYTPTSPPPLETFPHYVRDENVTAKLWPSRPDSYLLVSPGADGVFGTADDITNFPAHGR